MDDFSRRAFLQSSAAAQTPIPAKPNILVIMFDQWRFDCLGANGNKLIKTPSELNRCAVGGQPRAIR